VSVATGTLLVVPAFVVGHALAQGSRVARWIDALTFLAFVTPSAVLGAGLMAVWNHPATRCVYGTPAILVLGAAARYAVLAVRAAAVDAARLPAGVVVVAAAAGASWARRMVRVVAPLCRQGWAGAWILATAATLRDLELSAMFYPPGFQTLPVRLFTLEANGAPSLVAALALVQVAMAAGVLALGSRTLAAGTREARS
jgi:iron(III) transport system permease protein